MSTTIPGWTTLAETALVLVHEYSFGAGRANALAVALPNRRWMIVSPPPKLTAEQAEAFTELGQVVALVENNGTHHMGLGPCRARFPDAVTYAEPKAAARIRSKNKDAGQLEPIDALKPLLGDAVSIVAADGCKIGDVIVRVKTERGTVFYASDFLANINRPPSNPFALVVQAHRLGPGPAGVPDLLHGLRGGSQSCDRLLDPPARGRTASDHGACSRRRRDQPGSRPDAAWHAARRTLSYCAARIGSPNAASTSAR